ncbi:MAG: S41 family peptidase [Pseudomonadota bacterium]
MVTSKTLSAVSFTVAALVAPSASAQTTQATEALLNESESWFRSPALSPDGNTIVFQAYGDLWTVPSTGGTATALTRDNGWDGMPVWSRDGTKIAFASDRNGDLDVYVMMADGTALRRLTHHDANDMPSDFSPDGSRVMFSSSRAQSAASSYYPTGALPQIYDVAVTGGTPRIVTTVPGTQARYSPDGTQIAYRDQKAYENEWRQRDVSSFARDVWIYDLASGNHRKVTDNPGGDHSPNWSPDGLSLFMQSEINGGSFNLRRVDLESGASTVLSQHGPHPARGASVSSSGAVVYSYHGVLHLVQPNGASQALSVTVPAGRIGGDIDPISANSQISEFAIAPDGSEIAYIFRGEVFVTDMEFADTIRVTDTPGQERSISFAPDGKTLLYAAEHDGGWGLYETSIAETNAPRFSLSAQFETNEVYKPTSGNAFQPAYSPDGETIGFILNRDEVAVIDRDGNNLRTLFTRDQNYSYSDGDISFHFSPDSKWVAADYSPRGYYFYTDIGLAPVDGSEPPRDISINGYQDGGAAWHPGGDVVYWYTDRFGERSHGSWGSEGDIVAAFLSEASWTRFNLTEQERAVLSKADENKSDDDDASEEDDEDTNEEDETPALDINALLNLVESRDDDSDIQIDFDAVEDRTVRLTPESADLAGAVLGPDLEKLYYLAAFEGGYDLWVNDLMENEAKRVAPIGANSASMALSDDGKMLIILADGRLHKATLGDKIDLKPLEVSAEMRLRSDAEREYIFDHTWHQVDDKFYDPNFHGVDWPAMKAAYGPKVAAISNNRDFAVMMSELLGQLNASHTGMRYFGGRTSGDDQTAALGVIFDLDGSEGLRIAEILRDGPLDRDVLNVSVGDRIVAIDGQSVTGTQNAFEFLNRKAGDRVRLAFDNGQTATIRTYSRGQENAALYDRWIERRRAIVDERSNGRIGFVHIRSMSDTGYRQIFSELFGRNYDKEAVIVDTRFNGGGWLHDDLITLLDGESYFDLRARDRIVSGAPEERWTKPSAVVMNEGNYSNAHMFPYAYDLFDIGPTIGMPVPGTATAVWWEGQVSGDLVFGIPQLPVLDENGVPLENQELQPTLLVDNPPELAATGRDLPLETAVSRLLSELDGE